MYRKSDKTSDILCSSSSKGDLVEDFNKVTSDSARVMHLIPALPEGWVARKGDGRHIPGEVVEHSYLDQQAAERDIKTDLGF